MKSTDEVTNRMLTIWFDMYTEGLVYPYFASSNGLRRMLRDIETGTIWEHDESVMTQRYRDPIKVQAIHDEFMRRLVKHRLST